MENGKYAQRIAELSRSSGLNVKVIPVNLKTLQDTLLACGNDVAGVIAVHCETSSGKINPVNEIGEIIKKCNPGRLQLSFIVVFCSLVFVIQLLVFSLCLKLLPTAIYGFEIYIKSF